MRGRVVPWVPAAVWAAVLFFASSFPTVGVELSSGRDKVAHFLAYLVLGVLLARPARRLMYSPLIPIVLGALFGLSDEFHQAMVPGRSSELADWVADLLGTVAGVLIYLWFHRRRDAMREDLDTVTAQSTTI